MIKKYRIFGDVITLNTEEKTLQVNDNKKISFERLNEIVKECKNVNRMHKPIALLLYTDYKNGKLNNYKECEI